MRKLKYFLVLIILTFVSVGSARPAATASKASGNWNSAAVWTNGVPGANDVVTITAGNTVTVNVNTAKFSDLTIQAGAVLRGDGTGMTLWLGKGGGEDFTNDGTLLGDGAQAMKVALNRNSQWGGAGAFQLGILDLNTKTLSFTAGSSFTVKLNASPDPILNPGGITPISGVVFAFGGTSAQNLSAGANVNFYNLIIDNPAGVTLKKNLTTTALQGNLNLTAGSLLATADGVSAFSISGNGANTLTLSANSTLQLGSTAATASGFPSGFLTYNFNELSTVDYSNNSSVVQAMSLVPTYGNVHLGGSGGHSLASGTLTLIGNWTNDASGALTIASPQTVVFGVGASSAKVIGGSSATTFNNLTVNNSSGISLGGTTTVNGNIALGSNVVSTGVNILAIGASGSVSRTTGYVNGYLQKQALVGPANLTFEVGDASTYAPVDFSFSNVTSAGGLVVSSTAGEHPSTGSSFLDPSKDANRYWSVTSAGIGFTSYSVTLHFVSGDLDGGANTANFAVNKYNSPTWYTETTGLRTATSTQALGLTSFCDFVVGELQTFTISASAGANGTLTPNGSVVVSYGSNQAFTVTPNTGYHIDSVLVDGVDQGPVGSYTFTNVTTNHTIRTIYAIDQFTITATEGSNGTLSPNGPLFVNYGANQSFTITENTGYHIDSVLVDGVDQGPVGSYTFTNVTTNHTIRTIYAIDQFTITATEGSNGTLSPNGSVVVNYGSNQGFTVTPNTGYHIDSVLVDGVDQGPVGSYTFTNVTTNHTIRTVYAIDQFTITATEGSNGMLSPNGPVFVNYGANQNFTITENTGYHIDSVLVDGVDQGPVGSYTFTNVTANHTIRTVYAIDQFTITATAGSNGSISPSGSVALSFGDNQIFTITPNTGYHVDSVLVDGADQGPVGSYTFTNVTTDHAIRTVYVIDQFTITATAGSNGTLSPDGSVAVSYGANQGFTITPNTGYYIADVQVDSVSVGQVTSYTFTNVTSNHTIEATFAITQYTISASAGSNGSIAPSGAVLVDHGASQGFTITPNTGYYIADVQVDSVSVGQVTSYTFTNVTADHTIEATFAITQYTVTAAAGSHGTLTPAGSTVANFGDSLAYTITPDNGYYIVDVQVDTVSVGAVTQYTFTNITANHLISAVFAALNHAPSASRLLLPASGDTLVIENIGPAVGFTWRASADSDVADALTYSIHLSGPGIDSVMAGLTDTTLQWGISSMLQSGGSYWWTVNVTDAQAVTASPDTFTFHVTSLVAVLDARKDIPKTYALFQNFPNPFNPTTVVRFDLPRASEVRITVYNLIGQEVAVLVDQTSMGAGHHEVSMDAGSMSSGVYLYRITAKGESGDIFSSVKKMVLVK